MDDGNGLLFFRQQKTPTAIFVSAEKDKRKAWGEQQSLKRERLERA